MTHSGLPRCRRAIDLPSCLWTDTVLLAPPTRRRRSLYRPTQEVPAIRAGFCVSLCSGLSCRLALSSGCCPGFGQMLAVDFEVTLGAVHFHAVYIRGPLNTLNTGFRKPCLCSLKPRRISAISNLMLPGILLSL